MKKNKRMTYSNGGGVKLTKNFKNVQASLNHFQNNSRTSTTVTAKAPKTSVDVSHVKFGNNPASKKITVKRKIGKNFEIKVSKHDKDKSVGIQYTRRFK